MLAEDLGEGLGSVKSPFGRGCGNVDARRLDFDLVTLRMGHMAGKEQVDGDLLRWPGGDDRVMEGHVLVECALDNASGGKQIDRGRKKLNVRPRREGEGGLGEFHAPSGRVEDHERGI